MKTVTQFSNIVSSQDKMQLANCRALELLAQQGERYPLRAPNQDALSYYDAVQSYCEKLSCVTVRILREEKKVVNLAEHASKQPLKTYPVRVYYDD